MTSGERVSTRRTGGQHGMTTHGDGSRGGIGDAELAMARETVARHLRPTPLIRFHAFTGDVPVYLKLETAQPGGSFKVRGALAAAAAYAAGGRAIVTASAGNHALGIAYAAETLGVDATVVVPRTGSTAKIDALRGRGVRLVIEGKDYDEAEAVAKARAVGGVRYVSAYNDPFVIAGQSTAFGEIDDQLGMDCTVVMGVGGGGLMAGIALGARRSDHAISVVGVESDQGRAVSSAVAAGRVVPVPIGETIADGLVGNIEPSTITPIIAAETGVQFVAVDEPSIRHAVAELVRAAGVVAEGSAAVGLAALRAGMLETARPIVLVISGRNIATSLLADILREA